MSSDIQFGELEHSQPELGLRPDQDAHFATCEVDEIGEDELLIFVDLDVLRDMEAHAVSNTRVELGGVMLGKQHVDDQGRPFVVVTDSLRAEHYEATKGSFKFTHETWSQITRQRDQFRPDLEMVGWYHTHPGWSVFLSGMDLFICNNFFNRPLDVALVIDPCEQDRGWFQWTDNKKTRRTNGFVLTTGRFRQQELEQFANQYSKDPIMNMDPRYSGQSFSGSQPSTVTLMDNRKSGFELAIIGMLMMQFLLFCLIAWKFLAPGEATAKKDQERIVELEGKLAELSASQNRSMREDALSEVLSAIISPGADPSDRATAQKLVDQFSNAKVENVRMQANLEGQLALADRLRVDKNNALGQLQLKTNDSEKLASKLSDTTDELIVVKKRLEKLTKQSADDGEVVDGGELSTPWWWLVIGSLVVGLLGSALGYALARREDAYDDYDSPDPRKSDYRENERDFRKQDVAFESPQSADTEKAKRSEPEKAEVVLSNPKKVALKIDSERVEGYDPKKK